METDRLTNVNTNAVITTTATIPEEIEFETRNQESSSLGGGYKCTLIKFKKIIQNKLPIFQWLPNYKKNYLYGDIIAGVTVGLTAIPQVMAYAVLAGLSPEYGLYSSFIGPIVYIFFGACRQVTIGPTAIIALLAFQTCGEKFPECVILTSFYSGIFELVLSFLRLGSIVSLISEPVTIGFTAGAALTISSSQLKSFFGLSSVQGRGFIDYWKAVLTNLTSISPPDAILGSICIIFLVFFQKLNVIFKPNEQTSRGRILKKIIWILSVSRNVLIVLTTTIIACIWNTPPFKLTGNIHGGLPSFQLPHFLLPNRNNYSMSGEEILTFSETWSILRSGPFIIAIVAILQNVAISKIYGSGQKVDGNQEMLVLGISKIIGGFFLAQPVSGSFSRSAVNDASGVHSPLSGLFTSCLILLSLGFLTSTFYYIPKASLAAVIICAVLVMIEYEAILPMWRISKLDVFICSITFISALILGMEYGIAIGVGISILLLLYESIGTVLKPELKIDEETQIKYIIFRQKQGLRFPGVDVIRKYINKCVLQHTTIHIIVLDCIHWTTNDYSSVSGLASLIKSLKKNGKYLILFNIEQIWINSLKFAGILDAELYCCTNGIEDELITHFIRKSFPNYFEIS